MVTKVQKWGNGQGLRLSKRVLDLAGIDVGDEVEIIAGDRQILIKKRPCPRFELAELVSRIPRGYKAKKIYFGQPVGKEE